VTIVSNKEITKYFPRENNYVFKRKYLIAMQCISVDKKITQILPLGFPFLFAVDRGIIACENVNQGEQTRLVVRQ
jgi:hypothetical protein